MARHFLAELFPVDRPWPPCFERPSSPEECAPESQVEEHIKQVPVLGS